MLERPLSPATRTVELAQLEQLDAAIRLPGAPRITPADLGLDEDQPDGVLTDVSYDGPPAYPYVQGTFGGRRIDLHTAALRELSRRLHLHHTWGA